MRNLNLQLEVLGVMWAFTTWMHGNLEVQGLAASTRSDVERCEVRRIRAYPPETAVAEKVEAICSIGIANSRMKDYYDLIAISRRFDFDGRTLAQAIAATFERRGTPIPTEQPVGLSERFAMDEHKRIQWGAFVRRTRLPDAPAELGDVLRLVRQFVAPPLSDAESAESFSARWTPSLGWRDAE